MKKMAVLLLVIMPLQAMFFLTPSKTVRQNPVQSMPSVRYQKALATKKVLQHKPSKKVSGVNQNLILRQNITNDNNNKFSIKNTPSKGSWSALLAALGLGWIWYNSKDEEKAKEETDAVLKICRIHGVDPLDQFVRFIKKYGIGDAAEQLFEQMIADDSILFNMMLKSNDLSTIPVSVVPFIKRHYYTLACSGNGSYLLGRLIKVDKTLKKELTVFVIRDMEKLCKYAQSDNFFRNLLIDNPEAINGLVKKAEGHVEELVETQTGKQLIDNSLIKHSMSLAKERATLLVNPSKSFDLSAFNTCMVIIKDDPNIEEIIKRTYKSDDFSSLLRKIVYQKHCQHCTKDDLSHASGSLKDLVHNIDKFASNDKGTLNYYIVPDKGLSHMVIDALSKENMYKNDYYVFYHGQSSKLGFQQRLFSWLVTKNDTIVLPVIYPIPRTKEEQLEDEMQLSKKKGSVLRTSWGDRTYGLYAGVGLFSNNYPLRFATVNASAAQMPFITTEQVCKDAHHEQVYALFRNELNELEHDYNKLHQKGQLLQFRVKKDKLEEYVFVSGDTGGKLKVEGVGDVSDIRSIVNIFRDNPEKINNASSFSVGISIGSSLSDPNSGIKCSIINSVDPQEWTAYEKKEKALRNEIDQYFNPDKNMKLRSFAEV